MSAKEFKKLISENKKHAIMWKIIKCDLVINSKIKEKRLTMKQYKEVLSMEN